MKNLKILLFFLILPVLLSAQGLDRPHAIISNFNVTVNAYPTLTATGDIVSSDEYALIHFRDSLASSDAEIHITFDNTATSPYSFNVYKVTSVTQTTGNTGTFVMEAILNTPNSFVIPNVVSIEQVSDEFKFELYDKGETFNTTINKHNHNWITLDAALQNIEKDTLWKVECYTDALNVKYNVFTNLDGTVLAVNDTDNTDIQTTIPAGWNLCPTLVVIDSTWRIADSLYSRHVDNSMTVVSLNDLDSIWYSVNKDTLFSRNNQGVLDTFQGGSNILWATEDGVNESPIIQKANIYYMDVANFPTWIGMPNRPVPVVINSVTGTITLAQADADSTVADMLIVGQIGDSLVLAKDGFVRVPNYNGTFGTDFVLSQEFAGFAATSIVSTDSCTQYIYQAMGGEWIDAHISPAVCGQGSAASFETGIASVDGANKIFVDTTGATDTIKIQIAGKTIKVYDDGIDLKTDWVGIFDPSVIGWTPRDTANTPHKSGYTVLQPSDSTIYLSNGFKWIPLGSGEVTNPTSLAKLKVPMGSDFSTSTSNNAWQKVTLDGTSTKDTESGWNSTTSTYTVRKSGDYYADFNATWINNSATTDDRMMIGILVNGVEKLQTGHDISNLAGSATNLEASVSGLLIDLVEGDEITIEIFDADDIIIIEGDQSYFSLFQTSTSSIITPQEVEVSQQVIGTTLVEDRGIVREMSGRATTDGTGAITIVYPQAMADNDYSITVTAANGNNVSMMYLNDSTTEVQIIARDLAGNPSSTSFSWSVKGLKPQ